MMRSPKSTSIKNLIKKAETVTKEAAFKDSKTKKDAEFKEEDLIHYWNEYANNLEKKTYLQNTMLNSKPSLKENAIFEILIHNPGQQDELQSHSRNLLSFLRQKLSNDFIQMKIRFDEKNEKKLAYTASEKYEHLNKINPILAKLKDEFDLSLD